MKTFILAIALLVGSAAAQAGQKCITTYMGTSCYGNGEDSGTVWKKYESLNGNETWYSNDGRRYQCYEGFDGSTSCY